jgi:uncharacterized membrane protein YgcG
VNWLTRLKGSICAAALLVALVAQPRAASAGIHQLWDQAHLFKLETLDQVSTSLQQLNERFDKDLMIETFASIPDDFKQRYNDQDREKFYDGWAIAEGRQLGVNGILILITADPRHLHVVVGYETRKVAFTLADRDELVAQLTNSFRNKDYDGGITNAVKFVHDRMSRNLAAAATAPKGPGTRPATGPSTQPAKNDGPGSTCT